MRYKEDYWAGRMQIRDLRRILLDDEPMGNQGKVKKKPAKKRSDHKHLYVGRESTSFYGSIYTEYRCSVCDKVGPRRRYHGRWSWHRDTTLISANSGPTVKGN